MKGISSSSHSRGADKHYMIELNYDNGSTIIVKATNKEDTIRFKFERACNSMKRLLRRDISTQVYEAEWVRGG